MTSLQIQIPIYQGEWGECLPSPPQETQSFRSQKRSSSASGLNPGEGATGFLETVQKKRSPVAGGSEPSTSNALLGIWWFISLEPLYRLESLLSCQFFSWPQTTPDPALRSLPLFCGSESCLDDAGPAQTPTRADLFSGLLGKFSLTLGSLCFDILCRHAFPHPLPHIL